MLQGRRILLVIAGGIAAYKCLDLLRRLRERGATTRCILTKGGAQFVTPLSVATLSRDKVYQDLFSLTDESEIGHIRLARECDLVVVAPATADLLAKMAHGLADDLASTVLLATDRPILVAPAMNFVMWESNATQENLTALRQRGVHVVGPDAGELAEGESGVGRMSEPLAIVGAIESLFASGPLKGKRALVTSGPTYEPVDPVRFIGNRSSGKQGHAIATALALLGADTTLVTGPTRLADPRGVTVTHIESADEMLAACRAALPVDIAVCAAAVADWKPRDRRNQKIKKNGSLPALELVENPDILATLSAKGSSRPSLVIGFAAETENVVSNATAKRHKKGCDWIVANDVSAAAGTFGGDANTVHLIDEGGTETWPRLPKDDVARRLAQRIADRFTRS
ncbi:MAG: bifunctional phosphopantothenoylcysteine decarboxylase/phosphopantothenate--cysteine ligase CoaBC [Alphaproteobacteria bacterium]|nr:bifunctional phosphopantothenoylcysteine decarboxylase/phosphopantothenate--cysteine ligase CoaBC [Alphaproteobacteria bacterium]